MPDTDTFQPSYLTYGARVIEVSSNWPGIVAGVEGSTRLITFDDHPVALRLYGPGAVRQYWLDITELAPCTKPRQRR